MFELFTDGFNELYGNLTNDLRSGSLEDRLRNVFANFANKGGRLYSKDNPNDYVVTVLLAGHKSEWVSVETKEQRLKIKSVVPADVKLPGVSTCEWVVNFPKEIDAEQAKARMQDGLLVVTVPKRGSLNVRSIPVE